jgi:putative flippase GtrA
MSDTQQGTAPTGLTARALTIYRQNEQLLKYFFIGATASAIDVMLFFILFNLVGTSELLAHSISVPTAVVFSFLVNARHNFKTNDHAFARFICFSIVCVIGYLAGYAVIVTVREMFEDPQLGANIGKVFSLPVVFIIQYLLNSRITFRKAKA